jgi:hypothetical protein
MADDETMPPGSRAGSSVAEGVGSSIASAVGSASGTGTASGIPLTLRAGEAPDQASFTGHVLPSITIASVIIPEGKNSSGVLIGSTSALWDSIVEALGNDWSEAYKIPSDRWEEIVAGAFK